MIQENTWQCDSEDHFILWNLFPGDNVKRILSPIVHRSAKTGDTFSLQSLQYYLKYSFSFAIVFTKIIKSIVFQVEVSSDATLGHRPARRTEESER